MRFHFIWDQTDVCMKGLKSSTTVKERRRMTSNSYLGRMEPRSIAYKNITFQEKEQKDPSPIGERLSLIHILTVVYYCI